MSNDTPYKRSFVEYLVLLYFIGIPVSFVPLLLSFWYTAGKPQNLAEPVMFVMIVAICSLGWPVPVAILLFAWLMTIPI